jgi:hypothetical protein
MGPAERAGMKREGTALGTSGSRSGDAMTAGHGTDVQRPTSSSGGAPDGTRRAAGARLEQIGRAAPMVGPLFGRTRHDRRPKARGVKWASSSLHPAWACCTAGDKQGGGVRELGAQGRGLHGAGCREANDVGK